MFARSLGSLSRIAFTGGLAALALGSLVHAQEVAVPCGQQVPFCYGEKISCAISPSTEFDVYQFFGEAGENLEFNARGLSNGLDLNLQLLGPDNLVLTEKWCPAASNATCGFTMAVTLVQSGMHTLVVSDIGLDNTGGYEVQVERILPLGPVPTIDYGQSTNVTLDHRTDTDWLQFEALAGTHFILGLKSLSNGLDPIVKIYDDTGTLIDTVGCNAASNATCTNQISYAAFPATGTYYMSIQDNGLDNTGSVTITLSCIIGLCPPPLVPLQVGNSYCAQTVNSSGNPATISAVGSPFVADDDVYLQVSGVPSGKVGIFFFGAGMQQTALPNSWGPLCITPPLKRRRVTFSCNNGMMAHKLDLPNLPELAPGTTWYFQSWFRDPFGAAPKTTTTSDGLEITFQ